MTELPDFSLIDERLIPYTEDIPIEPYPIAICTPFYNSEKFLNQYFGWLTGLDWPQKLISLYFTVQGDDSTYKSLKKFKKHMNKHYKKIKIKKMKQVRGGELPHVRNVVQCRNNLIQWSKPDPVLFIDHDNFPPPYAVKRLANGHLMGADIVGGVYPFYVGKGVEKKGDFGILGFTAFFVHEDRYFHVALNTGREITNNDCLLISGHLNRKLIGNRLWVEATSMGTTLIKRKVFDDVKFIVPWGTEWTDDTAFCIDAVEKGYKCMADFGLFVPHWGFVLRKAGATRDAVMFDCAVSKEMVDRRLDMLDKGVYVT